LTTQTCSICEFSRQKSWPDGEHVTNPDSTKQQFPQLQEQIMDTNKAEGAVQQLAGKVQDTVGGALGDTGTQVAGKARELGGKAQQLYADTTEIVRDKTTESPFIALAIVGVLGFFLGAMWAGGKSTSTKPAYPANYPGNNRY
jgi:uncharacterized protein YjbJ (UPF0337 family)